MYFNAENINLFTSKKCKKVFLGIFFLSSLGSLPSCRLPLNETPPPPSEIVVGMGDSNDCISRVNPTIQSFFKGEAADVQIQASFDCVSDALDTFEKSVKGQYPDRYTGREIAHFIEQYYLEPGHAFSDELMLRFFKIKQVFAGGNQTSISRQELKVLRDLMKRVRDLAIDMNTYMPLYSMS